MKNVFITGGAGFLGSHLSSALLQQEDTNVIALDNFITSDYYNIEEFVRKSNFEFLKHDLVNPINLEQFAELNKFKIKIHGIEEVYHLACPTSPKDYDRLPLETCLANSHATVNALEIARRYKANFLLTSSSAVYGKVDLQDQPVKENHIAKIANLSPRGCYIDGKRFAENLVMYYASRYNFSGKILRLFNTYGPKMRFRDGRIVPDFIDAAIKNEDIIIYGGKEATSTFCYASDMVDGLVKMMQSSEIGPFNIGAEIVYRLTDVAEAVITFVGSTSKIIFDSPLPYKDPEPLPDITAIKEKLGWIPITPLEEGLAKTIKIMRASQIIKFQPS